MPGVGQCEARGGNQVHCHDDLTQRRDRSETKYSDASSIKKLISAAFLGVESRRVA